MALTSAEHQLMLGHLFSGKDPASHPLKSEIFHPKLIALIQDQDYSAIADWYDQYSSSSRLGELYNMMPYADKEKLGKLNTYSIWHAELCAKLSAADPSLIAYGLSYEQVQEEEHILNAYITEQTQINVDMQHLISILFHKREWRIIFALLICFSADGVFSLWSMLMYRAELSRNFLDKNTPLLKRWQGLGLSEQPTTSDIQAVFGLYSYAIPSL